MLKQVVAVDDELASLIRQAKLIVEQYREHTVTLGEARQFLNELREREEYQRLSKASAENQAIDAEFEILGRELVQLALENRRSV